MLGAANDFRQVQDALHGVTGGLSIAFETTRQGLVAALVIQLTLTALKKSEAEFLDAGSEYCSKHIVDVPAKTCVRKTCRFRTKTLSSLRHLPSFWGPLQFLRSLLNAGLTCTLKSSTSRGLN